MAVDVLRGGNPHFAVHGRIQPHYDGFVDAHTHLSGDTADSSEDILIAAYYSGLTGLIVTDHDNTRKLSHYQQINTQLSLGLEIFPGVESTALMPDVQGRYRRRSPKHVLAIFDTQRLIDETVPEIPVYMPARELNVYIHEHGGKTSVAHPAMGGFSVTIPEILAIQDSPDPSEYFDFVEGLHGGVINLLKFWKTNPVLARSLKHVGLLPQVVDTNEITRNTFVSDGNALNISGMTAGSDAHSI